MNIDDQRPTDRPQGPFTHIGTFQMAITLQRVHRSPIMFGSRVGFSGTAD